MLFGALPPHGFLTGFDSCGLNHKGCLSLWEIRTVHKPGNTLTCLTLSEIQPERCRVADDVAADRLCRITKEHAGIGHNLIGHNSNRVQLINKLEEIMQMAVQLLLTSGKRTAACILGTEQAGQGVHQSASPAYRSP